MSLDPAGIGVADAENPQSLNLYGYVHNYPLAFVDPNGMLACPDGKWQDVACAVQTIGHAIGSFFSGLGGGADNSSVTTSETYSVDPGGSGGSSGGVHSSKCGITTLGTANIRANGMADSKWLGGPYLICIYLKICGSVLGA